MPLFISHRRLKGYKTLPVARGQWALDSGGFTELNQPPYRWLTTVEEYCGGLVGWDQWRDGCCLGGVACRRHNGTRFLHVLQVKR